MNWADALLKEFGTAKFPNMGSETSWRNVVETDTKQKRAKKSHFKSAKYMCCSATNAKPKNFIHPTQQE